VKIIRGRLSASDVTPATLRWFSDTNTVQQTADGGATWTDQPTLDPRSGDGYRMPARTSSDPRCDAAANMVAKLKSMVGIFEADLAQLQAVNALVDIVLVFLPEVGIVIEALLAATEFLLTIGADAIDAAFTDDQWQLVLCILECAISSDGTVTQAQFDDILDKMHVQCSTVVYDVLYTLFTLSLGVVGLSNAGATGTETGDCSECSCPWCYEFDFALSDGDWFLRSVDEGVYTSGSGWQAVCYTLDGMAERVVIQFNFPSWGSATLTDWSCHLDYELGDGGVQQFVMRQFSGTDGSGSTLATTSQFPPANGESDIAGSGSLTPGSMELNVWCSSGDCTGSATIMSVTLHGVGTNPFGTDNC